VHRRQQQQAEMSLARAIESERALRDSGSAVPRFRRSGERLSVETDTDGRLAYVSERFEALTGLPRSTLIGLAREAFADQPDTDFGR